MTERDRERPRDDIELATCEECGMVDWSWLKQSMPEHDVEAWEYHFRVFTHRGASIDISGCPSKPEDGCSCLPMCDVCGEGRHSSYHGPVFGKPIGSRPWGHGFEPIKNDAQITRKILRSLGR